jgi:hypothetical protein
MAVRRSSMALRTAIGTTVKVTIIAGCLFGLAAAGAVFSDDPLSAEIRPQAEGAINGLLASMQKRAAAGKLKRLDRVILHLGVLGGIVIGRFISPEGAAILRHAVYGGGSDLQLDPSYFKRSHLLAREIERRGPGNHGPIWFQQSEDMRLSLAFNPIYLTISDRSVRAGHPRIQFAAPDAPPVLTVIPIGKLRLRMFDNLVGALQPKPFAAYAEWRRE